MTQMIGLYEEPLDYWNIDPNERRTIPFWEKFSQPNVAHEIWFECNRNLVVEALVLPSIMGAIALTGGLFFVMCFVLRWFFGLFMPWFMELSIILRMFKVDPSKGKRPRDYNLDDTNPREMIEKAKERLKERVPITQKCCSLCLLIFEKFIARLCCINSKFGRIVNQGSRTIKRELNLFNFLKNQREI